MNKKVIGIAKDGPSSPYRNSFETLRDHDEMLPSHESPLSTLKYDEKDKDKIISQGPVGFILENTEDSVNIDIQRKPRHMMFRKPKMKNVIRN